MVEDYPELDEAMLNGLVDDYESNIILDDVPLPPKEFQKKEKEEASIPLELPPEFTRTDGKEPHLIVPKDHNDITLNDEEPYDIPHYEDKEYVGVQEDVENLDLLENVFDKRVTDEQIDQEIREERSRNDSGRLLDKKDVEVKTELNDKEIVTISKLRFVADRYDLPVLNDFTNNLMTLKISRNRKGRSEFIQGLHADERREQPDQSFLSKIFGQRGG